MQTIEKERTGVFREAFFDFKRRYGIIAFAAAALVVVKFICFYYFMGISNNFIPVCALSCLLVFLFFCACRRKGIPAVIYLLISLLMFADVLYHGYYNSYLTVRIIGSAKMIGDITASISELIKPQYFILFADNIAIFAVLIISAIRRKKKPETSYCSLKKRKNYDIPKALQVFAAIFLIFFMLFNPLGSVFVASVSAQELMTYHLRDLAGISESGSTEPYYIATGTYENSLPGAGGETSGESGEKNGISEEDAVSEVSADERDALFGSAEGRNLIVIQLEAFQNFAINREYEGQELTPFLNSLINDQESLYFDHYYYQVGSGNTSDAEFATNNSILGTLSSYTYTLYQQNYFRGLPVLLKEQGYETAAMHAYEKTFWNRLNMYPSLGFDHFFDSDYYEDDEDYTGWSVVATNDKSFFHQSVEAMKTMQEPFYSFLITLSGHHPFEQKQEDCSLTLRSTEEGTIVGDYLNSVRYVDEALEQFFEELKDEGLYENSIICIYGDHYGLSCTDPEIKKMMTDIMGEDYNYKWHFNIPLIINIPGSGVNETISTAGGQLDFLPTVAYLLGMESLDTIYLGQNLITAEEGFVAIQQFLPRGSFIDDDVVFRASDDGVFANGTAWEVDGGEETSIEGLEENSRKSLQYSDLSEFYLKYDVLDKALNKGMSVDEILSGMNTKGKPARIDMPLSSQNEEENGVSASDRLAASVREGYLYIQVNIASDNVYEEIISSEKKDEYGAAYSQETLMTVSDVCEFLKENPDVKLILRPVTMQEDAATEDMTGRPVTETPEISDDFTRLCEEFLEAAEDGGISGERYVWHTSDMDHYEAADEAGCENIVIEPDMSAYEIHNWNNFFMTYHPWAIFLPENISALYMNDLSSSSSEIYLVQNGDYDDSHEERMELTDAYGEVTYELEPKGQTEKEIMEIQAAENNGGGESSNLITEALGYISNGCHPAAGMAVVFLLSVFISLGVLADRKIRRSRETDKIQEE